MLTDSAAQFLKLPGQFRENESVHIGEAELSAESMTVATVRNSISYKDMEWYRFLFDVTLFAIPHFQPISK